MNKLWYANLLRLRKNKCFWGCMLLMAMMAVYIPVMRYLQMKETGYINRLDVGFLMCSLLVPIALSIFSSLFVGREYSDGTIRNKIMIGHKRVPIYLANLSVNMLVAWLLCTVFFVVYLCVGIPLLGTFEADIKVILLLVMTVYLLVFAYSCIDTMISMMITSKAVSSITCIMSVLFLILAGAYINSRLQEPKVYPAYTLDMDGQQEEKEEPNPNYLEGTSRDVYEFLYDFLPGGQVVQCASMQVSHPMKLMLYSSVIGILSTMIGMVLLNQKDLN